MSVLVKLNAITSLSTTLQQCWKKAGETISPYPLEGPLQPEESPLFQTSAQAYHSPPPISKYRYGYPFL